MNIAIDLRSLHTSEFSGVESYTVNVLERLLTSDRENSYTLFFNGFHQKNFEYLHFINAKYKQTRIPNRLLNISMKLAGRPYVESLIGPCDLLFLPNWNVSAVKPSTKVVLTVHDLSPLVLPELYNAKARAWHSFINIKKLVQRADHLLAVSEFTKQSLMDVLNVPEAKITVTSLGVDTDSYHPNFSVDTLRDVRNRYGLPGDYIFFVGTIEPRKNLMRVIEAFELLPGPTQLVIAGKWGWKYKGILDRIQNSPKRRLIKLLGYVPEQDKPLLMKLARVFIWPSLYEGFGLPVLEAMAVGTPVLTSPVTSLPEVAGDAALLISPYNTEEIAQGLFTLLNNETVRTTYSQRGIEQAKLFSWDTTAEIVKSVIHKL